MIALLLLQVVLPPPQHFEGGFTLRVEAGAGLPTKENFETGISGGALFGYRLHSSRVGITPEMGLVLSHWKTVAGFVLYPGAPGESSDDVSVTQLVWGFRLDGALSAEWALWEAQHFGVSRYRRSGTCTPDVDACRTDWGFGAGFAAGLEYRWMALTIGPYAGYFIDGAGPVGWINVGLALGIGAF